MSDTKLSKETITEADLLKLEVAREKINSSIAQAQLAIANSENAKLQYQQLILQAYLKYELKSTDTLNDKGEIIRNPVPNPQVSHEENNTNK